jgi:hypothetical protein
MYDNKRLLLEEIGFSDENNQGTPSGLVLKMNNGKIGVACGE